MDRTVYGGGNYLLNNRPMGNGRLDPEAIRPYGVMGEDVGRSRAKERAQTH